MTRSRPRAGFLSVDREAMVDAVVRLVRIPSTGAHESPAQDAVVEEMEAAGLEVDRWEIDVAEIRGDPHAAWEIERSEAIGLVGTLRGAVEGPSLALNGHVDVVPPGDPSLWRHPPYEGVVESDRIYGRGALDMKGPLMAGLYAIKAVRDAGLSLGGSVQLQSVIGEEDGGLGTLATIRRGYRPDAAIVMEPTGLAVAPVQAGCLNFRVEVPGLAAHGAVREEGVSAFEKLFALFDVLGELETLRNAEHGGVEPFANQRLPYPISIGTLGGGDWASSVPDHAVMAGRMGVRPDEDLDSARRELEDAVHAAAAADAFLSDHPPRVAWWGGRFLPASTDPDHPIVRELARSHQAVTGAPPRIEGVTFGSDAGLLQRVGGASVVLYGAGDIRDAHRPDESVGVADLVTMAEVLAETIVGFCGLA